MVEWDGLENRCGGNSTQGSNPCPSAIKSFIYVLRCADGKLYIGSTRELNQRLEAHKMGRVKTTKGRRPVNLIYTEELADYREAKKRELYLKTGTGRDWLKDKIKGCQSD